MCLVSFFCLHVSLLVFYSISSLSVMFFPIHFPQSISSLFPPPCLIFLNYSVLPSLCLLCLSPQSFLFPFGFLLPGLMSGRVFFSASSVLLWQCCVLCLVFCFALFSINSSQLCSPCISTSLVTIMCIYCASFPSFIFRLSLNPSSIFIFFCLFVF